MGFNITALCISDGAPLKKQYLILEDICQGFKYPCVVDVKIGAKTWDPLAPQAKIDHENVSLDCYVLPFGLHLFVFGGCHIEILSCCFFGK